jgi:hypothetical protein
MDIYKSRERRRGWTYYIYKKKDVLALPCDKGDEIVRLPSYHVVDVRQAKEP